MSETTSIDEGAQSAIEQMSDQFGVDQAELTERYRELLDEEQDKGVSDPQKRALRRLSLEHKGDQMSSSEQLMGYVLGCSDAINTSRSRIDRAKNYIQNNGVQRAVEQGLIKKIPSGNLPSGLAGITVSTDDGDETYAVLDTNDNSPTAGEVLPAEDWIRYIYGAVWRSPDDGPHWFSGVINAEDPGETPIHPPMFEPVQFEAGWVGESDQNNTIRLRFGDGDPFEPAEGFGGPDVLELLEDGLGYTDLEDCTAERFDRNDIVATYGTVTFMELAPEEDQSRRLNIVDPFAFDSDLSRTVWLSDHVHVNFGEDSDVYVVGQVSPSDNEYPDSIEALGVLPHPDYRVDRDGVESMADEGTVVEEAPDSGSEEGTTPAEAGAELEDPEEVEFESGAEVESGEDHPPIIDSANYNELQSVAAETDEVPGSGLSEDEMREQLLEALGTDGLAAELPGLADAPDQQQDAEDGTGAAEGDARSEDAEEPTAEDEDWEW